MQSNRRAVLLGAAALGAGAVVLPKVLTKTRSSPGGTFRLLLCGDIHPGENYGNAGAQVVASKGYDFPFERLRPMLLRADFTIANLEAPITDHRLRTDLPGKEFIHWTSPTHAPAALRRAGIDALGLANNHAMDMGDTGLFDTLRALQAEGLQAFGAGPDIAAAERPLTVKLPLTAGGSRHVAIFSLFEHRPRFDTQFAFYANSARPGVARLEPSRFGRLVSAYRDRLPNLLVIAYPHWGPNYVWRSNRQRDLGRALIDAGADIVIGHHGHTAQEIERYQGKWIVYGIGNLFFGSRGRFADFPSVLPYGLLAELQLMTGGSDGDSIRLYPVAANNLVVNYQPYIARSAEAHQVLRRVLDQSGISPQRRGLSITQDAAGAYLQLDL